LPSRVQGWPGSSSLFGMFFVPPDAGMFESTGVDLRLAALGQEVSSGSEERITADVLYRVRGGRIQRYSGERSLQ
jgi:hypothetical protein